MKTIQSKRFKKIWLYFGLLLILSASLWVGWSDFDPSIPQELVRENIRSAIRSSIQITIQYLVPLGIIGFFIREIMASRQSKP
jgi:hypothetical protein